MVQVDDLIEPGAKQILFTRLSSFPWPHLAPRKSFLCERITNQICKESPSAEHFPGKLDFHNAPFLDSKSRTWEFFTDDLLTAFAARKTGWPGRSPAMTNPLHYQSGSTPKQADARGGRNGSGAPPGESAPWAPSTGTCSLRPSAPASRPPWPRHRDGPGYHRGGSGRASGNCARNRASR